MSIEIKISRRLIPYKFALKYMNSRVDDLKKGKNKELLWILEHPTTFTGGIRSKKTEIIDSKIKLFKTNRGGKITLHNPGQKVIYVVLNLNKRKKDIRNLVQQLEKSVIEFLKIYKIKSFADRKKIGIWVKDKKISAIGIKVSRWIAYHGVSINIKNNLIDYKKILPCGLDNNKITSIKNEGIKNIKKINYNLKRIFIKNIKKI